MISGHLRETIMRVYDVRPSTAEFMMEVLEMIGRATKSEYIRGWADGQEALKRRCGKMAETDSIEFWRKRADYYSDMCMNLIGEMGKGVKIESVKISENGIEFIKEQPSAQPEIIRCKDCRHNGSFDTDCPIDWNGKEYCSFAER